jgi:hypothetical protein
LQLEQFCELFADKEVIELPLDTSKKTAKPKRTRPIFRNVFNSTKSSVSNHYYQNFRRDLDNILSYDQLKRVIAYGLAFKGFREAPISFPPTFKYDIDSDRFDSMKGRIPAWTDRILFSLASSKGRDTKNPDHAQDGSTYGVDKFERWFRIKDYFSLDVRSSDHRPVCADFEVDLTYSLL